MSVAKTAVAVSKPLHVSHLFILIPVASLDHVVRSLPSELQVRGPPQGNVDPKDAHVSPEPLTAEQARALGKKLLKAHDNMGSNPIKWKEIEEATKTKFAHWKQDYKLLPLTGKAAAGVTTGPNGEQYTLWKDPFAKWLSKSQTLTAAGIKVGKVNLLSFNVVSKAPPPPQEAADASKAPKPKEPKKPKDSEASDDEEGSEKSSDTEDKTIPGVDPLLKSGFLPEKSLLVIREIFRNLDSNPKRKQLPYNEIAFQYGQGHSPPILPTTLLSYFVANRETKGFIAEALKELDGKTILKPGVSEVMDKWFETLLGSDNGRAAQQMPNGHPYTYWGKRVVEIEILKALTSSDNPALFLTIGYLEGFKVPPKAE